MKISENLILKTDSYKISHHKQYPPDTKHVFSYLESRGGEYLETKFFGLQYIIKKWLTKPVTMDDLNQAQQILNSHMMNPEIFNWQGWHRLIDKHQGRLPVRIRAVPEGSIVPVKNVLMTIENTDPEFYWLTNYLETLLMQLWYPTTVATLSANFKKVIESYLRYTADDADIASLPFKLHDFGYRGSTSDESAAIGGAAHLLNFQGTDTLAAISLILENYSPNNKNYMPGFSIPASEHSTITSWGKENELQAMNNMLDQYPEGLVACVSDSFDIYKACEDYWGDALKEKILNRNGMLVVRPDSGNPSEVVLKCLEILGRKFGTVKNSKGFKVLPPQIRMIQGDGVNLFKVGKILSDMYYAGWSASNIAFGCGGALLQDMTRDTNKFAIKCSAVNRNGKWRNVYKDPVTDSGKQSKLGRLDLIAVNNIVTTTNIFDGYTSRSESLMQTVYENGRLLVDDDFETIRSRGDIVPV